MSRTRLGIALGGLTTIIALTLGILLAAADESPAEPGNPMPIATLFATTAAVEASITQTPDATASPTSSPTTSALIAIDAEIEGNDASEPGPVESCVSTPIGDSITVDVTVNDVPTSVDANASGLAEFQFSLSYDPSILMVTGVDTHMLLATGSGALIYDLTPKISQTAGYFTVAAADLSGGNESSDGVLARVTFQTIGVGTAKLTLEDITLAASLDYAHSLSAPAAAHIAVGSECAGTEEVSSGQ